MSYKLTIKVEEKQGQSFVTKWEQISECSSVNVGSNQVVKNGDKSNMRYEIDVHCSQIPG